MPPRGMLTTLSSASGPGRSKRCLPITKAMPPTTVIRKTSVSSALPAMTNGLRARLARAPRRHRHVLGLQRRARAARRHRSRIDHRGAVVRRHHQGGIGLAGSPDTARASRRRGSPAMAAARAGCGAMDAGGPAGCRGGGAARADRRALRRGLGRGRRTLRGCAAGSADRRGGLPRTQRRHRRPGHRPRRCPGGRPWCCCRGPLELRRNPGWRRRLRRARAGWSHAMAAGDPDWAGPAAAAGATVAAPRRRPGRQAAAAASAEKRVGLKAGRRPAPADGHRHRAVDPRSPPTPCRHARYFPPGEWSSASPAARASPCSQISCGLPMIFDGSHPPAADEKQIWRKGGVGLSVRKFIRRSGDDLTIGEARSRPCWRAGCARKARACHMPSGGLASRLPAAALSLRDSDGAIVQPSFVAKSLCQLPRSTDHVPFLSGSLCLL